MSSAGNKDANKSGNDLTALPEVELLSSIEGLKVEGTNEIFVSSSIFDALADDDWQLNTGANDLVTSDVLPSAALDKSFDSPVISGDFLSDDSLPPWGPLSTKDLGQAGGEGEVFASKLKDESGLHPHPALVKLLTPPVLPNNARALVQGSSAFDSGQHFGLPPLSVIRDSSHLHPEDVSSARKIPQDIDFPDFVVGLLYRPEWLDVLDRRFSAKVYSGQEELLLSHIDKVIDTERVCFVTLKSMGSFCTQVFVTQFLDRFRRQYATASLYGSILAESGSSFGHGLVSLLTSRIGVLKTDSDELKTERLLHVVNTLVDEENREWALSVLFTLFGLEGMLRNPKYRFLIDAREMLLPNVFELLRLFIEHDSRLGVVLIVLTESCLNSQHGWREIVELVEGFSESRVLLVFAGSIEGREDADSWHELVLPPIHLHQMRQIVASVVEPVRDKPMEMVDVLTSRSGGSLDQLVLSLKLLELRGVLQRDHDAWRYHGKEQELEVLGSAAGDTAEAFLDSLSEEQRYFLLVASIIGPYFERSDFSKLLALRAFDDEIPWFHDPRKRWIDLLSEQFITLGFFLPICDDDGVTTAFELRRLGDLGTRLIGRERANAQSISAFYAQILQRKDPQMPQIAEHFELGALYGEACEAWLRVARMASSSFLNATVNDILERCGSFTGPQHGTSFVEFQRMSGEYEMRFGHYNLSQTYFETMLRIAHLIEDPERSVDAFVGLSRAILMQGNYGQARDLLLFGLELAESLKDDTRVADCYEGLAEIMFNASDKGALVNALRYAEKALAVRRLSGELLPIARTLLLIAKIYSVRGDLQSAQAAITESYHAHMASGGYFSTPEVLATMAYLGQETGETELVAKRLNKAAHIAYKTGNRRHLFYVLVMRVRQAILSQQHDAVRRDLETIERLLEENVGLPAKVIYLLLLAHFDFSRRNFKKTTRALRRFFEQATVLRNPYLLSLGYVLSAELNVEVYRRKLGEVSLERTERLFTNATSVLESIGAWHEVGMTQRKCADLLELLGRTDEAQKLRQRADKVDPYCQ